MRSRTRSLGGPHGGPRETQTGIAAKIVGGTHTEFGLGLRHRDGSPRQTVDIVSQVDNSGLGAGLTDARGSTGPIASEIVANGATGESRDPEMVDQRNVGGQWMGHGLLVGL